MEDLQEVNIANIKDPEMAVDDTSTGSSDEHYGNKLPQAEHEEEEKEGREIESSPKTTQDVLSSPKSDDNNNIPILAATSTPPQTAINDDTILDQGHDNENESLNEEEQAEHESKDNNLNKEASADTNDNMTPTTPTPTPTTVAEEPTMNDDVVVVVDDDDVTDQPEESNEEEYTKKKNEDKVLVHNLPIDDNNVETEQSKPGDAAAISLDNDNTAQEDVLTEKTKEEDEIVNNENKDVIVLEKREVSADYNSKISLHNVANVALLLKGKVESKRGDMDKSSKNDQDLSFQEIQSNPNEEPHYNNDDDEGETKTEQQHEDDDDVVDKKPTRVASLHEVANIALLVKGHTHNNIHEDEAKTEEERKDQNNELNQSVDNATSKCGTAHTQGAPDDIFEQQQQQQQHQQISTEEKEGDNDHYDGNVLTKQISSIAKKEKEEICYLTEKQFLQCVLLAEAASKDGKSSFRSKENLPVLDNVHIPMDKMRYLQSNMRNARTMIGTKVNQFKELLGNVA